MARASWRAASASGPTCARTSVRASVRPPEIFCHNRRRFDHTRTTTSYRSKATCPSPARRTALRTATSSQGSSPLVELRIAEPRSGAVNNGPGWSETEPRVTSPTVIFGARPVLRPCGAWGGKENQPFSTARPSQAANSAGHCFENGPHNRFRYQRLGIAPWPLATAPTKRRDC